MARQATIGTTLGAIAAGGLVCLLWVSLYLFNLQKSDNAGNKR
jgi:hypothetical protein